MLLDHGLDVNTEGQNEWTPLMYAAGRGCESTVNTLISAGADIMCKDKDGNNALHLAAGDTITQL